MIIFPHFAATFKTPELGAWALTHEEGIPAEPNTGPRSPEAIRLGDERYAVLLAKARELEALVLPELNSVLNDLSGTSHSTRARKILLGHWLRRFIETFVNRTEKAVWSTKQFPRLEIPLVELIESHIPNTSTDFLLMASYSGNRYVFNQVIFRNVVESLDIKGVSFRPLEHELAAELSFMDNDDIRFGSLSFKHKLARRVDTILSLFTRATDGVITYPYIPRTSSAHLAIILRQVPRVDWGILPLPRVSVDQTLRNEISARLVGRSDDPVTRALFLSIATLLPVCFLEGSKVVESLSEQLRLPSRPKFILTGNRFDNNEPFKKYAARHVDSGTTYIVNQHGNNYGVHSNSPTIEEQTPDQFLTWGWTSEDSPTVPFVLGKKINKKRLEPDRTGHVLYVRNTVPFHIGVNDAPTEFKEGEVRELKLLRDLSDALPNNLRVRPHSFESHLRDPSPELNRFIVNHELVDYPCSFDDAAKRCRLVIFGYDSTGFLELCHDDFPCIAFSPTGIGHVKEKWLDLYQDLQNGGLFFTDYAKLSAHVATIWENVDAWWKSSDTSQAKEHLRENLARSARRPLRLLTDVINGRDAALALRRN